MRGCSEGVSQIAETIHGVVAARLISMDAGQNQWIRKSPLDAPAAISSILTKCDIAHS
jgi:hypothetical protein